MTPEESTRRTASAPLDRPGDDAIWPRVTREPADDLATDALARDRAGKAPFDEVARLQEAGLPALLTAPGPSGRGAERRTACGVVREIAAFADGLLAGRGLGAEERADIAVLVAAAETVANRAAMDITARALELVDQAPGTAARVPDPHGGGPAGAGLDRFWRNVRALTAPVSRDHRLRDIGDHHLHGPDARLTLPT